MIQEQNPSRQSAATPHPVDPDRAGPPGDGPPVDATPGESAHRDGRHPAHTALFSEHRNLLFTVAYELLGSAADAEDAVQDAWLRWIGVDLESVDHPKAYLVRIATRQALQRLRSQQRRRETYVGQWLPEPLLTSPDVAEDVELADSVSTAMQLVLDSLTPTERAVFVLREVFALGHGEIAAAIDKSPAAVRQIAHRAREHVRSHRPREVASRAQARDALAAFQRAVETGDLQQLADVLAPEVVLLADGGGVKSAVPNAIHGADRVLRLLDGGLAKVASRLTFAPAIVNGSPALLMMMDGELEQVITVDVHRGLIEGLYVVRNPEKLSRLTRETVLSR